MYLMGTPVLSMNFMLMRPQPSSPFGTKLPVLMPVISTVLFKSAALASADSDSRRRFRSSKTV